MRLIVYVAIVIVRVLFALFLFYLVGLLCVEISNNHGFRF